MCLVNVPDLIADFLLVLLPVAGTATAEEDDGDDEEDQEHSNYGSCDDACRVGSWITQGRKKVGRFSKCLLGSKASLFT